MTVALVILAVLCAALIILLINNIRKHAAETSESVRSRERLNVAEESLAEAKVRLEESSARITALDRENAALTESASNSRREIERLNAEIASLKESHSKEVAEIKAGQEKLLEQSQASFKVMANDIMTLQTDTLKRQNEERLGEILNPIKENIESFRKKVDECYNTEARERFSLQERIKELIDTNNNVGREARELANVLKGSSKKQGDWGEMVLENILENSGLRRGEEYEVQKQRDENGNALRDENGRMLRPDVVVYYPGQRVVIIDSKVSLTAYMDYSNAETQADADRFGKMHLASVIKHINELANKNYQDYLGKNRLDFVMMFIPNEAAYNAAMTLDPGLWVKAYEKGVLMVSPTQLISSLRIIKQVWNTENQARNAIEIAEKSGSMYDKFVGFVKDMEKIDSGITQLRSTFGDAMNKLSTGRGNLVRQAESLRKLGIKAKKRLPEKFSEPDDSEPASLPEAESD